MLIFADSAWHVLSALLVFILGIWVALSQAPVFAIDKRYAVLCYFWHSALCLLYFYVSITQGADSTSYFLRSLKIDFPFSSGTAAVTYFTSLLSGEMGLSYGGVFFVYNILGFFGMLAFAAALQDAACGAGALKCRESHLLVLLPGLSFWSSAIGKDALTFMATGLISWGVLNLDRRKPSIFFAFLIYLVVRPHIAAIFLTAFALSFLLFYRTSLVQKILACAIVIPSAVLFLQLGLQYAGLSEAQSFSDFDAYISTRQGYNLEGDTSVDISAMPLPVKVLTYLYRPFFFDAGNLFGLAASLENLVIAYVSILAVYHLLCGRRSSLPSFALTFNLIFSSFSLFVLASTSPNLGIAMRQKWMFLPMMLISAVSLVPKRFFRR